MWIKRLLLFSLLIVHHTTFGQLFEKVEHLAGLDFFAQNNGVAIAKDVELWKNGIKAHTKRII